MTRIKIESNNKVATNATGTGLGPIFILDGNAVDMSKAIDWLRGQFVDVTRHVYVTAVSRDIDTVAYEVLDADTEHPNIASGATDLIDRFVKEYGMTCADAVLERGVSGDIDAEKLRNQIEAGIISEQFEDCDITYEEAYGVSKREKMIEDGELEEDSDEEVDEALPSREQEGILRNISFAISEHIANDEDFKNLYSTSHNLAMDRAIPVFIFTNYNDVANSWVYLSEMDGASEFINKVNSTLSILSDIVRTYAWDGFKNVGDDWDAEDLLDFAVRRFGEKRNVDASFLASETNILDLLRNFLSFIDENSVEDVERIYNDTYDNNGVGKIIFGALCDTEDPNNFIIAKGIGEAILEKGFNPEIIDELWENDTNGDLLYLANEQFRKLFGGPNLDSNATVPFILKHNGVAFDLSNITCAGWVYLAPRGFEARRAPSDYERNIGEEDYLIKVQFDVMFSQSPVELD